MKKTIAILAVMVIALACVFAGLSQETPTSETHNIKLKTNVGVVVPVYQLQFVSGSTVSQSAASVTNQSEASFSLSNKTDNAADIEVLDISKNDIAVTFKAYLLNEAKINKTYTISFSATSFAVKKNGADAEVAVASQTTTASGTNTGVTTAATGNDVTATFNGTTCVEDTVLATYVVTYNKDTAVDPHTTNSEYYYATVTMTVSAS